VFHFTVGEMQTSAKSARTTMGKIGWGATTAANIFMQVAWIWTLPNIWQTTLCAPNPALELFKTCFSAFSVFSHQ